MCNTITLEGSHAEYSNKMFIQYFHDVYTPPTSQITRSNSENGLLEWINIVINKNKSLFM